MTETYAWRGGSEMLLRHGKGSATTLLVIPALFEEANRMRRFTVSVMRALAERGIGTLLPDLPGTGESLTQLADVSFVDWQDAIAALVDTMRREQGRCLTVAVRGGATLDAPADSGWRLAPETGERVLRDLVRATTMSSGTPAKEVDRLARTTATSLAGNIMSPAVYHGLQLAPIPSEGRRTVRLAEDAGACDLSVTGTRLWRAAEPGDDPAFVEVVATDIAEWTNSCANQ